MKEYWISLEYVPEIKRKLWHVYQGGWTDKICIDAFEDKEIAQTYCNFLNNN